MKRLICLMVITTGLVISLVGCSLGTPKGNDENVENDTQIEEVVDETTDELEEVVEETDKEVEEVETEVEDDTTDTTAANVSTDWKSYQFVANGQTLTLPCTYEELKAATGYTYKSADEKSYLEDGYYTFLIMQDADGKSFLNVDILNQTGEDALYTELPITRITSDFYNNDDKIVFPGGLTVGQSMTVEEVKALFGEPTDINDYVSEITNKKTYILKYCENEKWTTDNYYEITIKDGVISGLELDNY